MEAWSQRKCPQVWARRIAAVVSYQPGGEIVKYARMNGLLGLSIQREEALLHICRFRRVLERRNQAKRASRNRQGPPVQR